MPLSLPKNIVLFLGIVASVLFFVSPFSLFAQTADDSASSTPSTALSAAEELRNKIDAKNRDIAQLERDIKVYQDQILKASTQGKTLQSTISVLELTRKKLVTDMTITQNKVDAATLSIQSLSGEITNKEEAIAVQMDGLRASLLRLQQNDSIPFIEVLLRQKNIGEAWNTENQLAELQGGIKTQVATLNATKTTLTNTKTETEKKKRELIALRARLNDQKKIVEANKVQTNDLLKQTKNTEENYKRIVAASEARRLALQKELNDYESQLKLTVDPTSYPSAGKVLRSPLGEFVITQLFGDTEFARAHAGAYNGKGHNGIDLKASVGTPVYAALAGVVVDTGNTDTVCPGASYGKWVFIKHGNGLSTVYAHLSLIKATAGQQVETGDLIGYSGSTGYVTGPHLHFGLFASQGVRVVNLKSKVCSGTYTVPVADYKAYLNPMQYL